MSRSVSIGSPSLASDLSDALDWVGPELQALVAAPGQAIHQAITNGLLVPRQGRRRTLDDTKRPMVDAATAALTAILGGDNLLVAAWRDLVAACRNIALGGRPLRCLQPPVEHRGDVDGVSQGGGGGGV